MSTDWGERKTQNDVIGEGNKKIIMGGGGQDVEEECHNAQEESEGGEREVKEGEKSTKCVCERREKVMHCKWELRVME